MNQAAKLARQWIEIWDRGEPSTLPLADELAHLTPYPSSRAWKRG